LNPDLRRSKRRRTKVAFTLVGLMVLFLPTQMRADDNEIESHLKSIYVDNILTLRHFYTAKHLKFRADGTLVGDAAIGPWTLASQFRVKEIRLNGSSIKVKGRRIQWIFDGQGKSHDQLMRDEDCSGKCDAEKKALGDAAIEIAISLPSDKPTEEETMAAMNAVFLPSGESMVDIVPPFWQAYFAKREGKVLPSAAPKETVYVVKTGEITPPRLTFNPDPDYAVEARRVNYQGSVLIGLVVDSTGKPQDLQIEKPLGMGLEEKAVASVKIWKFEPALKDGKPVPVRIHIQVIFHLY
jgi:TonB family protein